MCQQVAKFYTAYEKKVAAAKKQNDGWSDDEPTPKKQADDWSDDEPKPRRSPRRETRQVEEEPSVQVRSTRRRPGKEEEKPQQGQLAGSAYVAFCIQIGKAAAHPGQKLQMWHFLQFLALKVVAQDRQH